MKIYKYLFNLNKIEKFNKVDKNITNKRLDKKLLIP